MTVPEQHGLGNRDHVDQDGPVADGDKLALLRDGLERIGEVAVEDRVALFERANTTIARELAALDEV